MFKRNLPVLVNLPMQVPSERSEERGMEVARLASERGRW